jgi:hypothetical protein
VVVGVFSVLNGIIVEKVRKLLWNKTKKKKK